VVDGYGWPALGIFDLGWHEKTKYRLDPGFYQVDVQLLINLDSWKRLDAAQQKLLSDTALWIESLDAEWVPAIAASAERQDKAGIQTIKLGDAEAKTFVDTAYEAGWKAAIAKNPELGAAAPSPDRPVKAAADAYGRLLTALAAAAAWLLLGWWC